MTSGWHILHDGESLTLTRRLPARMDVGARVRMPSLRLVPLAHHIRQDIWRALQNVRGFSPVVRLVRDDGGILVHAGGRLDVGRATQAITECLTQVLSDPARQTRWIRWSR